MQAAPRLIKLCLALLLAAPAVHAGELKLRLHLSLSGLLHGLFPPPSPTPSVHHLGMGGNAALPVKQPVLAIDGRTFVADGIHYRLQGVHAAAPGSPEELEARVALQALLDSGARVRVLGVEPSGIRSVTLAY
jgi:hypothetical protein